MPIFRTLLILFLLIFLWRLIKIVSRMLNRRQDYEKSSMDLKENITNIEEATFEDITDTEDNAKKNGEDIPKI
jgi:hypothetical protein